MTISEKSKGLSRSHGRQEGFRSFFLTWTPLGTAGPSQQVLFPVVRAVPACTELLQNPHAGNAREGTSILLWIYEIGSRHPTAEAWHGRRLKYGLNPNPLKPQFPHLLNEDKRNASQTENENPQIKASKTVLSTQYSLRKSASATTDWEPCSLAGSNYEQKVTMTPSSE